MTIAEVLREMRAGLLPKKAWADAIEAAMREPVAEVVPVIISRRERYTEIRPKGKAATVPGTKLYAFPPTARAEIERLREPVAETWQAVIDRIAPALEILSAHDAEMYPAEAALALDRTRIRRELAAIPHNAQAELVKISGQLAERDAKIERLRDALQQINDRPWMENALDPQWAAKVAATALAGEETNDE